VDTIYYLGRSVSGNGNIVRGKVEKRLVSRMRGGRGRQLVAISALTEGWGALEVRGRGKSPLISFPLREGTRWGLRTTSRPVSYGRRGEIEGKSKLFADATRFLMMKQRGGGSQERRQKN